MLPPIPAAAEVLQLYRITAMRKLGQNFILDQNIANKLIACCGSLQDKYVVEVGPGPGSMTRSILQQNPKVLHAIEKDKRFRLPLELLQEVSNNKLVLHFEDILNFTLENLFRKEDVGNDTIHVLGNLPFNISTPLIIKYIHMIHSSRGLWRNFPSSECTFTFQHEVAERICARAASYQRCRLSVMVENVCIPRVLYKIPRQSFVPPPKVDAAVVHFRPKSRPVLDCDDFGILTKVVRVLFSHKNKPIRFNLNCLFPKGHVRLVDEFCERYPLFAAENTLSWTLTLDDIQLVIDFYRQQIARNPSWLRYEYNDPKKFKEQTTISDMSLAALPADYADFVK